MTHLTFYLYLTCLFWGSSDQTINQKSTYVHQENLFYSANVGDNVTLRCFYNGDAMMFNWYKQTLGQKPRLLSTFYKHDKTAFFVDEIKDNPRFTMDAGNGKNHLTIMDLRSSDSATYYCVGCYSYDFDITEGATVTVKGSGLEIQASVHQSGLDRSTELLNCAVDSRNCVGEHSVHWFKYSEESLPGIIYAHGQCERKPNKQTHTCKYQSLSHDGIYCAIVTCGHMLFGNKERLESKKEDNTLVLINFLIGALVFTTILALALSYASCTLKNDRQCAQCAQCADFQAVSSPESTPNAEGYQDSDNIHYAALKKQKINRSRYMDTHQHMDTHEQTECVYSLVRK